MGSAGNLRAVFAAALVAVAGAACSETPLVDDGGTVEIDARADLDGRVDLDAPIDSDGGALADGGDGGASDGLRVVASIGAARPATGGGLIVIASISTATRSCSTDGSICVLAGFGR